MRGVSSRISSAAARPSARAWNQALRDDRAQVERELQADLVLAPRREEVEHALDRLVRVVRVQRREAQVAGLGEVDRGLHRLGVADLADQDHVGRLAQRVLERVAVRQRVDADLALRDDALLLCGWMNSTGSSIVTMWPVSTARCGDRSSRRAWSTCRCRCRRPRSIRPAAPARGSPRAGREVERLERRTSVFTRRSTTPDGAALAEDVHAEPAPVAMREREVHLELLGERAGPVRISGVRSMTARSASAVERVLAGRSRPPSTRNTGGLPAGSRGRTLARASPRPGPCR